MQAAIVRWTKVSGFDPLLPTVWTAYPAQPLTTFPDPPIQRARSRPRGRFHLNRRVHLAAILRASLLQIIEPHTPLEHAYDSRAAFGCLLGHRFLVDGALELSRDGAFESGRVGDVDGTGALEFSLGARKPARTTSDGAR